jgi:CubicO group peptidase (beta-lactamase class C family)
MNRIFRVFLLFPLVLSPITAAATESSDKVANLVSIWNKAGAPGLAWVVISNRLILEQNQFGLANLEQGTPITSKTRFNIGSLSKQFTGFAVLKLAREGKLSLDQDIRATIPELPVYPQKITIRHLLHHTSGLQDWDQLLHLAGWELDDVITHEQLFHLIKSRDELLFPPGEKFLYSNSGYTLLATAIARATGREFGEWMSQNVFEPLGMRDAVIQSRSGTIIERRAASYENAGNGKFRQRIDNAAALGSGSVYCSIEDFAQYLQAWDDDALGRGLERLLEREPLSDGGANDYAFGLELGKYKGRSTIGHGGAWAGFRAFMLRFPEKHLSIALFSNHGSVDPWPLVSSMAAIYLGLDETNAPRIARRELELDSATLDAYVGQYELAPGLVMTITKENGHLASQATGFPREPLFAESRTNFFFEVEDSTIAFVAGQNGLVSHLILNRQGNLMEAKKNAPFTTTPEILREYLGDYFNHDLNATYQIRLRDGALVAVHSRHSAIPLLPAERDKFSGGEWWFGEVAFRRDRESRLSGFEIRGSRIKPVWFALVSERDR